jgi:hypothetical protein
MHERIHIVAVVVTTVVAHTDMHNANICHEHTQQLTIQVLAEKKRGRKKERLAAAKLRQRVAMNMEAGSFEVRTCA